MDKMHEGLRSGSFTLSRLVIYLQLACEKHSHENLLTYACIYIHMDSEHALISSGHALISNGHAFIYTGHKLILALVLKLSHRKEYIRGFIYIYIYTHTHTH
jgi:hypothetical protein